MKFSQKCDGEIKCGRNHCETAVTAFDFDILLRFLTGNGSTEQEQQMGNKLTTWQLAHCFLFLLEEKKSNLE